MKKTGQLLKDAREKKRLSLHEIGMSLKINPKTLQSMEEGELDKLPAKSFLRGFVKSYAVFLKMDANAVLAVFQSETEVPKLVVSADGDGVSSGENLTSTTPQIKTPAPLSNVKPLAKSDPVGESLFSNKALISTAVAVLVILIVSTAKLVDKYQRERVIDRSHVQKIQATQPAVEPETALATKDPLLKNIPDEAPTLIVATEEKKDDLKKNVVKTKTEKPEMAQAVLSPNLMALDSSQSSRARAVEKVVEKIDVKHDLKSEVKLAQKAPEQKPGIPIPAIPPVAVVKPTEVIVEALNKVSIKSNLGDGKIESIELLAEQMHTFKSKTVVELDISDGGSVNIIVNGRERGVPGSSGKPLRLTYPKK